MTLDSGVGGRVVVRANILGTVVGPSSQDPWRRITVAFSALVPLALAAPSMVRSTTMISWREDGKSNNLNVIASEIRRVDATSAEKGEVCAICLAELAEEKEEADHG
eukprot:Skav221686  [mRNA]  locus=scaffold1494:237680:239045:+ [translate_table: standard]